MPSIWKIDISLKLYNNIIKYKNNKEKLLKLIQIKTSIPYNNFIVKILNLVTGYDLYSFGYLTAAKFINNFHFLMMILINIYYLKNYFIYFINESLNEF